MHTIRIISTVCSNSVASIESAFLEVATSKPDFWEQIEIDTGEGHLNIESTRSNVELSLINLIKPYWLDVRNLVERAHRGFCSIPIIAWDLAITESGPILIEGNRGWGVVNYQVLMQKPLLKQRFLKIYLDKSHN